MMVSKINFQILIATMNRENLDFLYKMFPHHNIECLDIIIVNQTSPQKILKSDFSTLKVINSYEIGLSRSRNLALINATSKWCLIADDDLKYCKDFEKIIKSGIEKYASSGVIVFKSLVDEKTPRRHFPKSAKKQLDTFEQFNVASFEMLLNRSCARPVFFNECFGLGSGEFLFGEETVLMCDYMRDNRNISYYNKTIVFHSYESTGTLYSHPLRYYTKGGVIKYCHPCFYSFWVFIQLFFDLKQNKMKFSEVYKNFREAKKGANTLKRLTNAIH
jgi:glycosyltransferase involved in cell wall biosynthesis